MIRLSVLGGGLLADVDKVRVAGVPVGALRGRVARSLFGSLPLTAPAWLTVRLTETGAVFAVDGLVLRGLDVGADGVTVEI